MARDLGIKAGQSVLLYFPVDPDSVISALGGIEEGDREQRNAAIARVKRLTTPHQITVNGIFDSGNSNVDAKLVLLVPKK